MNASWSEEYRGGSPEAERLEFQQLAREMMLVQLKNRKYARKKSIVRFSNASGRRDAPVADGLVRPERAWQALNS